MDKIEAFEEIYREYLEQLGQVDLELVCKRLGLAKQGQEAIVPLFGHPHRVSSKGILNPQGRRPIHSVCVILSKYLILCPEREPTGSEWVTYREFKDAAPFVGGFLAHAEKPIAQRFAGELPKLIKAAEQLAGKPVETEVRVDLAIRFQALPKLPMLLLINDQDEDFPAQCSLLFESRAQTYLDMECLAMMGWVLADWLARYSSPLNATTGK